MVEFSEGCCLTTTEAMETRGAIKCRTCQAGIGIAHTSGPFDLTQNFISLFFSILVPRATLGAFTPLLKTSDSRTKADGYGKAGDNSWSCKHPLATSGGGQEDLHPEVETPFSDRGKA